MYKGGSQTTMPDNNPGLIASANASKDAAIAQSNNMVSISQTQAATMQLGILENSKNAQFQTLAWMTDRLDSNDTKVEIARENANLQSQALTDKHDENMKALKNDARELDIREIEAHKPQTTDTTNFLT
jgi:hypothetical protein